MNQHTDTDSLNTGDNLFYSRDDFVRIPKCDAHLHYDLFNDAFLKYAGSINMRLLTINTTMGESIGKQFRISKSLKKKHPFLADFVGTFDPAGFSSETFVPDTIARIRECIDAGARGIKVWKNIGMALKDKAGKYIMADHPVFAPVFACMEKEGIVLTTHLGEPRNCWLPYNEITLDDDLQYYKQHPEYHMYQHPDMPSYEQQISVRDHLLEKYPELEHVGAHLGSLEWNIDEVACRLDRYPRFSVDLSARMGHLQLQAICNREKVYSFFTRYQDRLLYGSDCSITERNAGTLLKIYHILLSGRYIKKVNLNLYNTWLSHWLFLATDEEIPTGKFCMENTPATIKGLKLPKKVIDKIFFGNAVRIYKLKVNNNG